MKPIVLDQIRKARVASTGTGITVMVAFLSTAAYWAVKLSGIPVSPDHAAIVGGIIGCVYAIFRRRSMLKIQKAVAGYYGGKVKDLKKTGTVKTANIGGAVLLASMVLDLFMVDISPEVIMTLDVIIGAALGYFMRRADADTQDMVAEALGKISGKSKIRGS